MASKRRASYTVELKRKAIEFAESHGNRSAGREFNVDESMVRRWRGQKATLEKLPAKMKAMRGGKPSWPELEKDVKEFVLGKLGRGLSTVVIRARARQIAEDRGLTNFIGGPAWCHRFMKRNDLSVRARTTVGQRLPPDWQVLMNNFVDFAERNITRLALSKDKILNMDEVPMTFDAPMNRTVTVLKPMVIFKRITQPKEKLPSGVVVMCNKKGTFKTNHSSYCPLPLFLNSLNYFAKV